MAKNFFSRFATWFDKNFIVSYDQKQELVIHNLKTLPKIMPLVAFFGIINAIYQVIQITQGYTTSLFELSYYSGFIIFPTITIIWCKINLKKRIKKLLFRNLPMYFSFFCIMALVLSLFVFTKDIFNSILVFASLITISPILFYLEPIFYNTILLFTVLSLTPILSKSIGTTTLLNFYLYIFIMFCLSFYKWNASKKTFEANKINENHAKQLDKELLLASNVQNNFYQHKNLNLDGWEIGYYSKAMSGVTGDLFDFFHTDNKLEGFYLFDISGHGLSSGLITMLTRTIIQRQFTNHKDEKLEDIMYRINTKYNEQRGNIENYMSGIIFKLNQEKFEMVNAAHPYPFIYSHAERKVKLYEDVFSTRGTAIGLAAMQPCFIQDTIDFSQNDEIILYTDGITEAINSSRVEYGYDRFQKVLQENITKSVSEQITSIIADVSAFVGNEPANDDITLVILRKK